MNKLKRLILRKKRAKRVHIKGTMTVPRLSVFKSNRRVYLQLIDDSSGNTVAGVLSDLSGKGADKKQVAHAAGKKLGTMAAKKGIKQAAFDRGGYKFHGRVKAALQGAQDGGLLFSLKKSAPKN